MSKRYIMAVLWYKGGVTQVSKTCHNGHPLVQGANFEPYARLTAQQYGVYPGAQCNGCFRMTTEAECKTNWSCSKCQFDICRDCAAQLVPV